MSGTNGVAVLDRVRQALAEAQARGQQRPGRPKLVELTGASDYQVRKALAELADQTPAPGETGDALATTTAIPAAMGPASAPAQHQPPDNPGVPVSPVGHRVRRPPRPWPLLAIGLAAAVAVWSGWVGLGQMTGFGVIQLLPGIWDDLRVNTAVVLPVSVEAYAAYALRVWLGTETSAKTTRFARRSAIFSLVVGAGAQVAYHLMSAAGFTRAPWPLVTLVAIVPVVVLGLASALAKLVANDARMGTPGE
jgi:hypothetical protein